MRIITSTLITAVMLLFMNYSSAEPSTAETKQQLLGTWKSDYTELKGALNGQQIHHQTEESEEGDQITFYEDGTFEATEDGDTQEGKYKLHSGNKLEILDVDDFMHGEHPPEFEDFPLIFEVDVDNTSLTLTLEHSFTEEDMVMDMTVIFHMIR